MEVDAALAQLGGVAATRQLLRYVTERQLKAGLDAGLVVRVARGRYALSTVRSAEAAALRLGGTLACLSAAQAAGWELAVPPDRPWIAVPRSRGRVDGRGVHLIYSDARETDPRRIVVQCARRLPWREGLTVADSALRSGQVDADELVLAAAGVHGKGAARARRVALEATPLAANALESVTRSIGLDVPGLTLVPQAAIELPGLVIHPDLVDRDHRIVIEAEGWLYHGSTPEAFDRDVSRYTMLVAADWRVARFTHRHVMHQPDFVTDTLVALVQAGRQGPDRRSRALSGPVCLSVPTGSARGPQGAARNR